MEAWHLRLILYFTFDIYLKTLLILLSYITNVYSGVDYAIMIVIVRLSYDSDWHILFII